MWQFVAVKDVEIGREGDLVEARYLRDDRRCAGGYKNLPRSDALVSRLEGVGIEKLHRPEHHIHSLCAKSLWCRAGVDVIDGRAQVLANLRHVDPWLLCRDAFFDKFPHINPPLPHTHYCLPRNAPPP